MSTVTDLESYQQFALQQQAQNNAWSAEQAQKQMDFQREMSNTAHQREVADLRAAGLNPILSANSGASVPNGAQAESDRSAAGNVGAILQQVLQTQSAREVAAMYNAATINAASIAANASMYGADVNAETQREYPNSWAGIISRVIADLGNKDGDNKKSKLTSGLQVGATVPGIFSNANPFSSGFSFGDIFNKVFKGTGVQKVKVLDWYNKNKALVNSFFKLGRVDLIAKLWNVYAGRKGKF